MKPIESQPSLAAQGPELPFIFSLFLTDALRFKLPSLIWYWDCYYTATTMRSPTPSAASRRLLDGLAPDAARGISQQNAGEDNNADFVSI